MKRKLLFVIPLAILVTGYFSMQVLIGMKKEPERRLPEKLTKLVNVQEVTLGNIPSNILAYGRIATAQPVMLYSEVNGTVEFGDIPFKPAQSFRKGDLLLRIDDRQVTLDLNTAKSDLLNALAMILPEIKFDFPDEYPVWQSFFESVTFNTKISDLPETANQRIKLFLSRYNVYKLYFVVRDFEIVKSKHSIYAPFDGVIRDVSLYQGSSARNGSLLGEIVNLEFLEAEIQIPVEDIGWINRSRPVRLFSDEISGSWSGFITRVDRSIDQQNQTVRMFVSIDPLVEQIPANGLFVRAQIPGRVINDAASIPRRLIYNDSFVYVLSNGNLKYREVDITRSEFESVIVTSGLKSGDLLVTDLLQGVSDGMPAQRLTNEVAEGGIQ